MSEKKAKTRFDHKLADSSFIEKLSFPYNGKEFHCIITIQLIAATMHLLHVIYLI